MLSSDAGMQQARLDRDLIEARVREILRLRLSGRREEAEVFFSPDIVVESLGPKALRPWTGRFAGIAEIRGFRRDVLIEFELIASQVLDLAVDGRICLVRRRVTYRNRGGGPAYTFQCWERYLFGDDGLVASFVQQMDAAALARLTGRLHLLMDVDDADDAS